MSDVRALTAELEQANARAQAILTEFKTGMPAEKRNEVLALTKRANELAEEIKAERALDGARRDVGTLTDFLEKPQYRVPRAITPDDDGKKALLAAGWEIKAGVICAPTSVGTHVEMYPEEVLFGEIPKEDQGASEFFTKTRAAFAPGYRAAYAKMLLRSAKMGPEMAWTMLGPDEQKALSEGTDTAGGFLVPPDIQAEMFARLPQMGVMRSLARVQPTSRDVLRFPAVAPHATSGSLYSSGFVGGWAGETPAFSDTDPSFQLFDIAVKKIRVATKLSNDFVADSVVNVLAFLARNGAENMALVEDSGFIAGDGGPLQPVGILNSGAATVDVEGSTANTISNASGAGSSSKIVTLAYTVPAQYASRAVWLMRRAIEGKVRNLNDSGGRPLWPPYSGSGFAPAPVDLLGARVYNSDFVPTDGTDTNKVLIYGDLGQYVIAQRAQVTSLILRERFADVDQLGIILFERVGGALWNTDAVRIGVV